MSQLKWTDFRGNDIGAGDVVVYPGRKSSSLWLTEARVQHTTITKNWRGEDIAAIVVIPTKGKRKVTLTCLHRIVVVG
jgi:hypothetical protein